MSAPRNWRRRLAAAEAAQRRIEAAPIFDVHAADIPREVRAHIADVLAGRVPTKPVTIPLPPGGPRREVIAQIGAVMGCDMNKVLG